MFARSLYIHYPFCESKCRYCDFYSLGKGQHSSENSAKYLKSLETELWLQSPLLDSELDTIYFGGGTPSLIPPEEIERLLHPIRSKILHGTEWTLEANPSSVSRNALWDLRKLGVNRLSMGVQSMNKDSLQLLGRIHSPELALGALTRAFEAGFEDISVDLLCGIPGQTTLDLEESLRQLTAFPLTHLSCYLLTLSPENPLVSQLPSEETQLEHLIFVDHWLTTGSTFAAQFELLAR